MTISVTMNEEQIRAAILESELSGPVQDLELQWSDGYINATITFRAPGVVSAEQGLSTAEILGMIRNYLLKREYVLERDASVTVSYRDGDYTAHVSVEQIPASE